MSSVFKEIQYLASVSPPTLSLTEKEILCPASLKSILTNVVKQSPVVEKQSSEKSS